MFDNLRPLFPYMRRYRRGFIAGGFFADMQQRHLGDVPGGDSARHRCT